MRDPDVVVIGAGPNGLCAATRLARQGLSVLVLESHPRRPGGAVGSEELTLPGFVHDVGAAFFPLGRLSPAFAELGLEQHGLGWTLGDVESVHPAADGSSAAIFRLDLERSDAYFGDARDTRVWETIATAHRTFEPALIAALLGPLPGARRWLRLGTRLFRLGARFLASTRGLGARWVASDAGRRVLPALALHADVGPDDFAGAALGYVLALSASSVGYAVPRGGAQAITNALVTQLERAGGRLRLGARVERVLVRSGRAVALRVAGGDEIAVRHAVVADTSPATLLLDLVGAEHLGSWTRRAARRYRPGWGTFKLDWALSSAVPWRNELCRRSATVHVGESVDALRGFTHEVRAGRLPEHAYLVVGQQSLLDPTRAPAGNHTLYAYTHVPATPAGGWDEARERFADRVEGWIEALAPGFRATVLARHAAAPPDLERGNANLVGGDLGGGSARFSQQLFLRPFFPAFRYRMPIQGLYLCSSSTHPGSGVHGMCGYNAAGRVLGDLSVP